MTAREIEQLEQNVAALTQRSIFQVATGATALVLAIVASVVAPQLTLPLLVAGLVVGSRGMAAYVRRCWLIEDTRAR